MKTYDNVHDFASCHSNIKLPFLSTIIEQLLLPLRNKYFANIIDITKQLN